MWELDYTESWAPKNWCFWTVVLEKTLKSPLNCKEIQPVHPKGDQSWVFIARTDVEAETPILWPPDTKSWLVWKDPDAGKDWGEQEKGMTEDEGLILRLRRFPEVGNGNPLQYSCLKNSMGRGAWWASPWGHKESDWAHTRVAFPVVMYKCENCTIKESWAAKSGCFWIMVWRRLLRVPLTAR